MHSRQFSLVVNQVLFVLLAYTLMQGHLFLRHRQELNRRTRSRTLDMLGPTVEVVAVYYQQRFCLLLLPEFGAILLEVTEPARAKLLKENAAAQTRSLSPAEKSPLALISSAGLVSDL